MYPSKWIQSSNLTTLRVIPIVVGFFRVGATIRNINIDSLYINSKLKHVLEIILNFNIGSALNILKCIHKKKFHKPIFQLARFSVTIF